MLAALVLAAVVCLCVVAGTSAYYSGSGGESCGRCHEIRPAVEAWSHSSHRAVSCASCHGSSLTADLRMHAKSLERAVLHVSGRAPEQIHVRHTDIAALVGRCATCHRQEHADWQGGPHGTPYAGFFVNPEHNARQQLMDDCLRCHAMHFQGGIADLVTPVDRKGPWTLVKPEDAGLPALPCLSCHAVHRAGEPMPSRTKRDLTNGPQQEITRPSLAFYDRRSQEPIGLERLPLPRMWEGERAVRTSPDRRQALCYQCHAPRAGNRVFSGDDRTPVGVHEGLSCLACHAKHGQTTRASCAACHPRLSNCGLDVETMDTSFKNPESPHDIHRVACRDCHPKGPLRPRRSGTTDNPRG